MRFLGPTLFSVLAVSFWASYAPANPSSENATENTDSDDLELVPLVNPNAPLVIIWTSEADDVPIEDATAIDGQIFEEMQSRRDARTFSRDKTLKIVDGSGDKRLMHCKWQDPCLVGIGKLAKADMVMGIKLTGTKEQYFLAIKLIRLKDHPSKVMKFSSGQLSALLVGGISKAIDSILKAEPKPIKKLPPLPEEKSQTSTAKQPQNHLLAQSQPNKRISNHAMPTTSSMATPAPVPKAQIMIPSPIDEVQKRPEPPGFFSRHLGSTIAAGLGVAFAGTAIGFGVGASNAKDSVEFQWDPSVDDAGRSNALTANILFGLSAVSMVVSVVLFVMEPSAGDYLSSAHTDDAVAVFRF